MKKVTILSLGLSALALVATTTISEARNSYGGGSHSSSHGGSYSGGSGSSHKGGTYYNSSGKNEYGSHKD
jgi:hypothetical protein